MYALEQPKNLHIIHILTIYDDTLCNKVYLMIEYKKIN